MAGKLCVCAALLIAGLLCLIAIHQPYSNMKLAGDPQRIVSLAPAITDTLLALDLGDRIAGITTFCAWPEDTPEPPRIGGFQEVNPEAVARSGADLAILPADMAHFASLLENMGLSVMLFNYFSLNDFLKSVTKLGELAGVPEKAADMTDNFKKAMAHEDTGRKPTVLFAIMSPDECQRPLTDMTIIGADGFYNDLLEAAGGRNAYGGATPFPRLSMEAIIAMNPDIIAIGAPKVADMSGLRDKWRSIGHLRGIHDGRLLLLSDRGDTIPGPGSLATLAKLKQAIAAIRKEKR